MEIFCSDDPIHSFGKVLDHYQERGEVCSWTVCNLRRASDGGMEVAIVVVPGRELPQVFDMTGVIDGAVAFPMQPRDATRYASLLRERAAEQALPPGLADRFRDLARRIEERALIVADAIPTA
jgi:hypothetical protein